MRRIVKKPPPVGEVPTVTIASVPDKSVADRYVHRTIDGRIDFEVFDLSLENALNVLIEGPTGSAKTMAIMAWAAAKGLRFYAIPSNVSIDPTQLFGKYAPPSGENGGEWTWIDGGVSDIVRNGGALLINEINFLPDRVSTVLFSLLDRRREITLLDHNGETVRAHRPPDPQTGDRCWCDLTSEECRKRWVLVVGDMNPGYAGTRELNAAFRNRFSIQLVWEYDTSVEKQLVQSAELLKLAEKIRNEKDAGRIEAPVSANMLMEFEFLVRTVGLDFAISNFVNHHALEDRVAIRKAFDTARHNLESDYKPKQPEPEEPAVKEEVWKPGPDDDMSALDAMRWVGVLEEMDT